MTFSLTVSLVLPAGVVVPVRGNPGRPARGAGRGGRLAGWDGPAGRLEQLARVAQVAPRITRPIGLGRLISLGEDRGRDLIAEGLQQGELGGVGQAR